MAAPEPPQPDIKEQEDWLVTYADAITLLMAFFVMLLTFAEYDMPAYQEAAAAIKEEVGGGVEVSEMQGLKMDVEDVVYNMQADQVVNVEMDKDGIVIELASSAFYKPGSAEIREQAMPVLEKISQTLKAPKFLNYNIEIEGHTDDDPINTARFPSNWELSAGRAAGCLRFLIEQEMVPERMKAVAFAETRPKVPNRDVEGNRIKENQAINRRVAIRVYPMSLKESEAFGKKLDLKEMLKGESKTPVEQKALPSGAQQALPPVDTPQPATQTQ